MKTTILAKLTSARRRFNDVHASFLVAQHQQGVGLAEVVFLRALEVSLAEAKAALDAAKAEAAQFWSCV